MQATIRVQHRGCVSEKYTGGVWLAQVSGERGHDLYVLHAPNAARLHATRAAIEAYVGTPMEVLHETPTSMLYRHHNPSAGPFGVLRDSGCNILWPVIWREGIETYTIIADHRARIAAVVPKLAALGSAHVDRIVDLDPEGVGAGAPVADLASGLTARQLCVLREAIAQGYYATPRAVSTADLARHFDIGQSTLTEHLRKAEAAVLNRLGTLLDQQPSLGQAAQRGPGRPPKS